MLKPSAALHGAAVCSEAERGVGVGVPARQPPVLAAIAATDDARDGNGLDGEGEGEGLGPAGRRGRGRGRGREGRRL